MSAFDYNQNFSKLNFRENPEIYRVGVGEQGVLLVEPYKSELLPHWRFKTPEVAQKSSEALLQMFSQYLAESDFAGMDMARKFLQMRYTRSRRYANHQSGKKYLGAVPADKKGQSGSHGRSILPLDIDRVKARSAKIFYIAWKKVEANKKYHKLRNDWKTWYG